MSWYSWPTASLRHLTVTADLSMSERQLAITVLILPCGVCLVGITLTLTLLLSTHFQVQVPFVFIPSPLNPCPINPPTHPPRGVRFFSSRHHRTESPMRTSELAVGTTDTADNWPGSAHGKPHQRAACLDQSGMGRLSAPTFGALAPGW
jgi:hypothetical protein